MIVLGVTGSIGMGKTTLSGMLQEMGIPVHDADAAVHKLLGPGGAAVGPVGKLFPEALQTVPEGMQAIDRRALGRIVFADPQQKKALEDILHPLVRADSDRFKIEMQEKGHDVVALDIPLLFETGGEARVDAVICVTAPPEVQRARVMARPGMTEEKFKAVLDSQMPDAEKRRRADHVIDTGKGMEDTRAQLQTVVASIRDNPPACDSKRKGPSCGK